MGKAIEKPFCQFVRPNKELANNAQGTVKGSNGGEGRFFISSF